MSALKRKLRTALSGRMAPGPGFARVHTLQAQARAEVWSRHRRRLFPVGEAAGFGQDAASRERLSRVAEEALTDLRTVSGARAGQGDRLSRYAADFDRWWRDTVEVEYMDDPDVPEEERTAIIAALDGFNRSIGTYGLFLDALGPLLRAKGTTRVMDLASGHGGFAIALARMGKRRGLDLEVTATDIDPSYLAVGEARAQREGIALDFQVCNALDLSSLPVERPDLIVCTQALHHFSPGQVAVMFDQACRVARRGVVFIDGCRNFMHTLSLAVFGMVTGTPGFVHDGVVSLRRFFTPCELELLADLVSRPGTLESEWMPPCHCLLRYTSEEASRG